MLHWGSAQRLATALAVHSAAPRSAMRKPQSQSAKAKESASNHATCGEVQLLRWLREIYDVQKEKRNYMKKTQNVRL
jgi:hypothetical protein